MHNPLDDRFHSWCKNLALVMVAMEVAAEMAEMAAKVLAELAAKVLAEMAKVLAQFQPRLCNNSLRPWSKGMQLALARHQASCGSKAHLWNTL